MKKLLIMGRAKSGKSVLLADYLKNSNDSVIMEASKNCEGTDIPRLVLDFNDTALIQLIKKNNLTDNIFIAPNRGVALELASSFNEPFMLVIDQARVTIGSHTMIDVAKELQLKYGEDMGIIITTGLSSNNDLNRKIIDRINFTLGVSEVLQIDIKDIMQEKAELLDCFNKTKMTIEMSKLLKKYHEGNA